MSVGAVIYTGRETRSSRQETRSIVCFCCLFVYKQSSQTRSIVVVFVCMLCYTVYKFVCCLFVCLFVCLGAV